MPKQISHYCQKCLAVNALGQDFCSRCGTRLMIVVESTSARFEAAEQPVSTDEHLLERISIVENRLTRLTERLERSLDLLLRQAANAARDLKLRREILAKDYPVAGGGSRSKVIYKRLTVSDAEPGAQLLATFSLPVKLKNPGTDFGSESLLSFVCAQITAHILSVSAAQTQNGCQQGSIEMHAAKYIAALL